MALTRDKALTFIRRWVELYGEPPRSADWNPSAAKWSNAEWRADRYRAGDPETGEPWPSLNAVRRLWGGSLTAAVVDAGFSATRPGPPARSTLTGVIDPDREVMSPRARVVLATAQARVRDLERDVDSLHARLDRARAARSNLTEALAAARRAHLAASKRADGVPRVRAVSPQGPGHTRIVRERVPDTVQVNRLQRKVDRLTTRLAAADAATVAERARAASATRDLKRARGDRSNLTDALASARADARAAERAVKATEDELAAAKAIASRERVVVRERVVRSATDQEVAEARQAVRAAERAADDAELRAARTERELRELGALVTGTARRLTATELTTLRKGGPSGPAVLATALSDLTKARKAGTGLLPAALTRVASAAVRWRDAL